MHSDLISKKILSVIIFYSIAFFGFIAFRYFSDSTTKIVFCDVGPGDATYIRLHNRIDILVDAGPNTLITNCLGRHMPFHDKTIEYAFLTHVKKSQYQGFTHVLKRYSINNFVVSSKNATTGSFSGLIASLTARHTIIRSPTQGEGIKIADAEFKVLSPQSLPDGDNRPSKKYAYTLDFTWQQVGVLFVGSVPDPASFEQADSLLQKTRLVKISEYGFETNLLRDLSSLAEDASFLINKAESVAENSRTKKISGDIVYLF